MCKIGAVETGASRDGSSSVGAGGPIGVPSFQPPCDCDCVLDCVGAARCLLRAAGVFELWQVINEGPK